MTRAHATVSCATPRSGRAVEHGHGLVRCTRGSRGHERTPPPGIHRPREIERDTRQRTGPSPAAQRSSISRIKSSSRSAGRSTDVGLLENVFDSRPVAVCASGFQTPRRPSGSGGPVPGRLARSRQSRSPNIRPSPRLASHVLLDQVEPPGDGSARAAELRRRSRRCCSPPSG